MTELFNVVLFFPDGSHHYEKRGLGPKEAVDLAKQCTERPAARIGIIDRVIITDGDDCTNFEWRYGKGVTFK